MLGIRLRILIGGVALGIHVEDRAEVPEERWRVKLMSMKSDSE